MCSSAITGVLVVVVMSLSIPAAAGARGAGLCSTSNAQHVLDDAGLTRRSDAQSTVPPQHIKVRRVTCADVTGDGRRDLLLTLSYRGTGAGDDYVEWAVFRRAGSGHSPLRFRDPVYNRYRYAFRSLFVQHHREHQMVAKGLRLSMQGGAIQERLRYYAATDKHACCPTGRYVTRTWHWNGHWLVPQ